MVAPPISSGMLEAFALHLGRDMAHLIERRRDQAGQTDDVRLLLARRFEDARGRHHDAEILDLVAVALQDHADDVLADVVDVALDRGHDDAARGFAPRADLLLRLHERDEMGDRLFHHAGGFHHLGQEHLAAAEEIADDVHAGHQRAFDHVERPLGAQPRLLDVVEDVIGDAVHERIA